MRTDEEILSNVMDEIKWEPILRHSTIGISVEHGIVELTGVVDHYGKRVAAENAAWRVKGVTAVAEELNVQLAPSDLLSDHTIAENILTAFKLNSYIPEGEIRITVTNGRVELTGEVDWNFQKDQADNTISNLTGIKSSNNKVTVKLRIINHDLVDHIKRTLERSGDFDAAKIQVTTEGTKVILKGTIRSRLEKQAVERTTWLTPGVSMIDNHLVIG